MRGPALHAPLLLALAASGAFAAEPCAKNGVVLFPAPGAVVPTNVQFILEGIGEAQTRVQALLTSGTIALVAPGQEPVELKPEKGFVSQMSRVAIRLRPLKILEPGVEYTLALPPEMAGVRLLNDQLGDGSLRWLTGQGPDKRAPKYKERPSTSEGFYELDKEGLLTRKLKLRTVVDDVSPVWFLITVQRARGGSAKQQYPVPLEGDSFTIGHDGCSGNFGFDDGRAYRLTVELYDAAGNRAAERASFEVAAPRPLQ